MFIIYIVKLIFLDLILTTKPQVNAQFTVHLYLCAWSQTNTLHNSSCRLNLSSFFSFHFSTYLQIAPFIIFRNGIHAHQWLSEGREGSRLAW